MKRLPTFWLTLVVIILLWISLTATVVPDRVFPSPGSVWNAATILGMSLLGHTAMTFFRVLVGWSLGTWLGIATAIRMSRSQVFRDVSLSLIELARPLPVLAWIPFFITWFGLGISGPILLVALGCFLVVVASTYGAIESFPRVYIQAARHLGASPDDVYTRVIRPGILPTIAPAIRTAAGLAFGLTVAAELIGAQKGLGFLITNARRTLNTNTILLALIVLGIGAYLVDRVIMKALARRCQWSERSIDTLERLG
jgi:ABC-type nitrate/sulfonate/bicarbonate transport system permease component